MWKIKIQLTSVGLTLPVPIKYIFERIRFGIHISDNLLYTSGKF